MLRIVILELPKVPETEDKAVWHWMKFFKSKDMEDFNMLARKYPDLEKPIYCATKMSLLEKWRNIQFHKNLWKVDERVHKEYIEKEAREKGLAEGREKGLAEGREKGLAEGKAEGLAEGKAEGLAEGKTENTKYVLELIEQGLSAEEIRDKLKEA